MGDAGLRNARRGWRMLERNWGVLGMSWDVPREDEVPGGATGFLGWKQDARLEQNVFAGVRHAF